MKEHVAPIAGSLGPVAAGVPDPQPSAPTRRRLPLTAIFYLGLAAISFATSTWPDWQNHGVRSGSVVSTLIAGGLLATGASRLRAFRRVGAATAR